MYSRNPTDISKENTGEKKTVVVVVVVVAKTVRKKRQDNSLLTYQLITPLSM